MSDVRPVPWGWTPEGYKNPTYAEIREDTAERYARHLREAGETNVDTSPDTPVGQIVDAQTYQRHLQWQAIGEIASLDPAKASKVRLDQLAAIVGLTRFPPAYATVFLELGGVNGATVSAGAVVTDPDNQTRFETLEAATLTTGGWSGSGGHAAGATVLAQALELGDIGAIGPDELTRIENPVPGWNAVRNPEAVSPGRDAEKDAQLRARMARDSANERATVPAIRRAMDAVVGVTNAQVYTNRGDYPDAEGRLPHSTHAILYPDTVRDDLVAEALHNYVASGTNFHGSETYGFPTPEGVDDVIRWDWAVAVELVFQVELTVDSNWQSGSDAPVADAIDGYLQSTPVGGSISRNKLICAILDAAAGIVDVAFLGMDEVDGSTEFIANLYELEFNEVGVVKYNESEKKFEVYVTTS